jgi:hypothetical protein
MTRWAFTQGGVPAEGAEAAHRYFVVECSEKVNKPAEIVWEAVRHNRAIGILAGNSEDMPGGGGLPMRAKSVSMGQRVMEIEDRLMLVRMEMTSGQGVPWSWCQSRLRVEPADAVRARITITCLAVSMAEPKLVEGVLSDLLLTSLQSLKQRVEAN